jgi:hypothetical protein
MCRYFVPFCYTVPKFWVCRCENVMLLADSRSLMILTYLLIYILTYLLT